MLEREESTRKYRHDMNNHLICLNQLAKEGTSNSVQEYISNMQNQVLDIQSKVFKVGNEILDAILNYHLSMLDKDVKVEIIGFCSEITMINNVDLCTIFANLIQNAVEELKKESSGEKYFKVIIQTGKEFIKIEIINTISDKSYQKSNLLRSEKKDKRNHGIGLGNVRQTVEKNGGSFETTISNHIFVARVILKRM
jgi:sensor histidine kinase regulating citrate/malate metabolism